MFTDLSIRQEIYKTFDAAELDILLREGRIVKSVKSLWEIERLAKVRAVLAARADGHPLMQQLLYTLGGQKVTYFQVTPEVEALVWGEGGDVIATVTMELMDDATQKHALG